MTTLISAERRRALAAAHGLSDAYLYQCLTGRRDMSPEEAVRVEALTSGEVRRWHLCPTKWHLIWPELVGSEGAPVVPTEKAD